MSDKLNLKGTCCVCLQEKDLILDPFMSSDEACEIIDTTGCGEQCVLVDDHTYHGEPCPGSHRNPTKIL